MTKSFRRIVTSHDGRGISVIIRNEELTPQRIPSAAAAFQLEWTTATVPVDNNESQEEPATDAGLTLKRGSVIRVVDIDPLSSSPMHRSFSIDYEIVLSGRLELQLDGGDVVQLDAGDIVVQRGTNHLWRNPSANTLCRIAFILIEAAPVSINGHQLSEIHP